MFFLFFFFFLNTHLISKDMKILKKKKKVGQKNILSILGFSGASLHKFRLYFQLYDKANCIYTLNYIFIYMLVL